MRYGVRATVIFILIIFLHCAYRNVHKADFKVTPLRFAIESTEATFEEEIKPAYKCCNRRKSGDLHLRRNILFLKTHKCGSSTVQNILMRFGLKHGLDLALPMRGNYLGYFKNISEYLLKPVAAIEDEKYNMLVHHTRYDEYLKKIMPNDSVSVTILREPSNLFESSFHFYKVYKRYGKNFSQFLTSLPLSGEFSQLYEEFDTNASSTQRIHDRNQMSLDLGLPRNSFQNITAIRKFIGKIDREFDLVMISEYMEASVVLLANLMGWPLHNVTFLPINSRPKRKRYQMTDTDRMKLSHFNYADSLLYRHFLDKFKDCLFQYGVDSTLQDIATLTRMNQQLRQKCVMKEQEKGYSNTINYKLKNNDWICTHSTKSELDFTRELRNERMKRLKTSNYTN